MKIWVQQSNEYYNRKVQWYNKEKAAYNIFFERKLEEIRKSEEQASKRDKERKEGKGARNTRRNCWLEKVSSSLLPNATQTTQLMPTTSNSRA
jgi:hypothetical protein